MKRLFLFLTFILLIQFSYAQGCSDAGFCSINHLKPEQKLDYKNQLNINGFFGKGKKNITVYGSSFEYIRTINNHISVSSKLTTMGHYSEHKTFGFGDLLLSGNYKINTHFGTTLGFKIPLSDARNKSNEEELSMDYQSSLGTFDFIVGINYNIKKLQLNLALQTPLTNNKRKDEYRRKSDILFRASYPIQITENLTFTPSLLPIYHIGNDTKMNETILNSKGLTLNGNTFFDYKINKNNALQLSLAMPFLNRKEIPDGLTRKFIISVEYKVSF